MFLQQYFAELTAIGELDCIQFSITSTLVTLSSPSNLLNVDKLKMKMIHLVISLARFNDPWSLHELKHNWLEPLKSLSYYLKVLFFVGIKLLLNFLFSGIFLFLAVFGLLVSN